MRNTLSIPSFAFLCLLSTEASAQDCGKFCSWDFWQNPTQQEVEEAIRNVDVSARTDLGDTPLTFAVAYGDPEYILFLLEAGADVNARDLRGRTPLHSAAQWGTPDSVAVLLDAGADVNARNLRGVTPLHYAAWVGTPDSVAVLLEAGADGAIEDAEGRTPIDLAKENEDLKGTDAYWALNDARFE